MYYVLHAVHHYQYSPTVRRPSTLTGGSVWTITALLRVTASPDTGVVVKTN